MVLDCSTARKPDEETKKETKKGLRENGGKNEKRGQKFLGETVTS